MQNQKQVWENIAEEWNQFKITPADYVKEFLKKQKGKILDLGSGSGRHLIKIKDGKMYLVDFSKNMIKLAKEKAKREKINAEFYIANLTKLPFVKEFFDSSICIASLHCIKGKKNREKALRELFRVLKKNSEIQIAVWDKDSKRFAKRKKERLIAWRDKGERYYYLFNKEELKKILEKVGFKIIKEIPHTANIIFIVKK